MTISIDEKTKQDIERYIEENCLNIAKKVNDTFIARKIVISNILLLKLQEILKEPVIHYEWDAYTPKSWDASGTLVEHGFIDLGQTVSHFLEEEYSGKKTASYMSGCGWFYDTYKHELSSDTLEIGMSIMMEVICECINRSFLTKFTNEDLNDLFDFDSIYDCCYASDFFFADVAFSFAEIDKLTLREIKEMRVSHIVSL